MRALSFLQPWLWAVVTGAKPVENRKWKPWPEMMPTPSTLHAPARRGPLFALQASAGWDKDGEAFVAGKMEVKPEASRRKAILGVARIRGYIHLRDDGTPIGWNGDMTRDEALAFAHNEWAFGPYVWVLSDVLSFGDDYIEDVAGALGFWNLPAKVEEQVKKLLVENGVEVKP
jgi:hypothetical protein